MKILILSLLLIMSTSFQNNSGDYEISGMRISLNLEKVENRILINGVANTEGWVCVGFNDHSGIVGADLKMLALQNGKLITSDRKTLAAGVFPEDIEQGGRNNMTNAKGELKDDQFHFSFTIPLDPKDIFDQPLDKGNDLWIILAYSATSDFDHHSRLRKHLEFQLPD